MANAVHFYSARFTVISPCLIRMEYSKEQVFVDEKTLFAQNRSSKSVPFNGEELNHTITIDTGAILLTYTENGQPFCEDNLKAEIRINEFHTEWKAGMKNKENLKGPMATLDGAGGYVDLPDGLLSKDGWYVVDDSGTPIFINDWIYKRPDENELDLYLFAYGRDYKSALKLLADVSGKMALPRKYTFGSWYSRWWPYTGDEFMDIVDEYEQNDFPLDILVMDMDWHYNDWTFDEKDKDSKYQATSGFGWANGNMGWTGYSWNTNLIEDPKLLLKELHDKGIYVTLNDHPADGLRDHEDAYPEFMKDMGYDSNDKINLPYDAGDQKYMDTLFKNVHTKLEEMGVDFWWVDWQQDSIIPTVKGKGNLKHLNWLNHYYYKHSEQNHKRGISFSRWGGFGDHKHPIYFSGDTISGWETLSFVIYFTLVSGNAGCFFWSHDTGGFAGERNPELYVRWVQFGMTSAAMRVHSMREEDLDRRPWKWGEMESDSMRKFFHLRAQLIPYIYSCAYQCYDESVPLLRPMYFEYPETDQAYHCKNQYFFGDAFIAAPITTPGEGPTKVAKQKVWIKEGTYYNFFTGEKAEGERTFEVSCDLFSFPLYVKAGMPIPMQPYANRMTSAVLRELIIRCYPGLDGIQESFCLYEDDGITTDFEMKVYLKTQLTYLKSADEITVTIEPGGIGYDGMPDKRDYTIELPLSESEMEIVYASNPAEIEFYPGEKCNVITLKNCRIKDKIEIVCK